MPIKHTFGAALIAAATATSAIAQGNTPKDKDFSGALSSTNAKITSCYIGADGKANDQEACCPKTGVRIVKGCPLTPEAKEQFQRQYQVKPQQSLWQLLWN